MNSKVTLKKLKESSILSDSTISKFFHRQSGLGGAFEPENRIVFCIVLATIRLCRRRRGQYTSPVVDLRNSCAADRYSVGYCHGVAGAQRD